jgi:hypothetical protein
MMPLLLSAAVLLSGTADEASASHRGAFAFRYAAKLTAAELEWYSRFDLLVTHDPLPPEQVAFLHSRGTKLVMYEWSVAYYDSLASDWQRSLRRRRGALLNKDPLRGGSGSLDADAWYFDPASLRTSRERAAQVAKRLRVADYDGVFLDTTTEVSVHPEARRVYAKRHPGLPYDKAYSYFLAALRKELGRKIIFTNQGYRAAGDYLPFVDWDLTESLISRPVDGRFVLRPWNDSNDPWNSTLFLMTHLIEPVQRRYPAVHFAHLNYSSKSDAALTQTVIAAATLFDMPAYVASEEGEDVHDANYFLPPGKPLTPRIDAADGQTTWRFFENVVVVVSSSTEPVRLPNRYNRPVHGRDDALTYGDAADIIVAPNGVLQAYFLVPSEPAE